MNELKALEARVKALETDDDFGLQTKVAPPAAPASSAASSADTEAVRARRPSSNVFVARRAVRRASRARSPRARPTSRPPPPQLKSENERLKKENETMAKLLAKERYRITHLIRTVESLTPA